MSKLDGLIAAREIVRGAIRNGSPDLILERLDAAIEDAERKCGGTVPRDLPGLLAARAIAEHNKLHWARKIDLLHPNPSDDIHRAKSAACFQVEMDIRSLTVPDKKGTGDE